VTGAIHGHKSHNDARQSAGAFSSVAVSHNRARGCVCVHVGVCWSTAGSRDRGQKGGFTVTIPLCRISGDKFATGSRINVPIAHAQIHYRHVDVGRRWKSMEKSEIRPITIRKHL